MKKEKVKFKVGDRVAISMNHEGDFSDTFVFDPNQELQYGEVISVLPKNELLILWESDYLNHSIYSSKTGTCTYEPKIVSNKGILLAYVADAQFSVLEKEYRKIEKEIKNKIKSAAKLIIEANNMAHTSNVGPLADMYDAISPLYSAMDQSGWNTSSFGC